MNADDRLARVFAEHNAGTECRCSICNIIRMCDRMADMTRRTGELVDRLR